MHPITVDEDGSILDGRNRLAACKLAGVEPEFQTFDGDDPDGYALAVNIARRHLTKGQQAMVAAKAVLVSNTTQQSVANAIGTSRARVAQAATVREHAPDLVASVIAGTTSLNDAYAVAVENKRNAAEVKAKRDRLDAEAPDLAARVADEDDKLTLDEAIAILDKRARSWPGPLISRYAHCDAVAVTSGNTRLSHGNLTASGLVSGARDAW